MARFRTKARAVDMLGRQQIADASTAISELFKNAHDAYADHVEADFFRSDSLLVIRDDGVGMTPEEFESNWLVLGTDSKLPSLLGGNAYRPAGKPARAVMGEKGIGRLAVAFLGPQVLIVTRSEKKGYDNTITMCYVHWGLFEQPAMNLDDVEIPVRRVLTSQLPSTRDVAELLQENAAIVADLIVRFPHCDFESILKDISAFQVDPQNFLEAVHGPTLAERRSGTQLYIVPAHESILADIIAEKESDRKEFSKCLLGFSNSAFAFDSRPPIQTAFRFWATDNSAEDLIGPNEFFTKDDLALADHFISGSIDEYGQFQGTVRVYEQTYENHVVSWKDGGGRPTECGPFRIEFGYLQGNQRESMADPEDFARINGKLDRIGGLYVYRDGIRILPYGNSDVDWLDIELRRNRGMGHYFFSYRRIYGAVCLTRDENVRLREKAGREGFQKDKAYRHLKSVLENLFVQLAADFFRREASMGDYFLERKGELDRMERARRKRGQMTTTKRSRLMEALGAFFKSTEAGLPECQIAALRRDVDGRMLLASEMADPDDACHELLAAEREANQKLAGLRVAYTVSRPRGVGLTKQLTRDWEAYQRERSRLEDEVFAPFATEVGETLGRMAALARVHIDQRRRIQELISNVADEQSSIIRTEAKALQHTTSETRRAAVNTARLALRELRDAIEAVNDDLAHRDLSDMPPQQVESLRLGYEQRIGVVASKNAETLGSVRELLAGIAESLGQGMEVSQLDMTEVMETELQSLREQSDADEELVQLGLAVAVINHEFVAAIKMIRRQLLELRPWAQANNNLLPIYQEIRANFDHLDAHLNLFTPLQRRLYRQRIDIQGKQIADYVRALFSVRLERHSIRLLATQAFLDSKVNSYPSTIYPVFVNLIDNFIFWLKDQPGERLISLDCVDTEYHIENNGPPVHSRDVEAIFEQGFSRKPGGRGLGLYISRKVLQKEGMSLELDTGYDQGSGVRFIISWGQDHE